MITNAVAIGAARRPLYHFRASPEVIFVYPLPG